MGLRQVLEDLKLESSFINDILSLDLLEDGVPEEYIETLYLKSSLMFKDPVILTGLKDESDAPINSFIVASDRSGPAYEQFMKYDTIAFYKKYPTTLYDLYHKGSIETEGHAVILRYRTGTGSRIPIPLTVIEIKETDVDFLNYDRVRMGISDIRQIA